MQEQNTFQAEVRFLSSRKKGIVFSIERYAIHDGPGIRTLVYLKGCSLRCLWCSNPEGQKTYPELIYFEEKCIGCGECIKHCPKQAIVNVEGRLITDPTKCDLCGECVRACPTEARYIYGKYMTVERIIEICKKDLSYYHRTEGGVTLSGGEPTYQYEFALAILKSCKENYINTAIETCGFCPWEKLRDMLSYTDYVLYDLKHINPVEHKKLTGVSNNLILDNLKKASKMHKPIFIRVPLIPNFNDSTRNIKAMVNFIETLRNNKNIVSINFLPYHEYGKGKYRRLQRVYPLNNTKPPTHEDMSKIKRRIKDADLKITIGG